MNFAYSLSGAAPLVKKHKIGITIAAIGQPIVNAAAGNAGVVLGTTTSAANAVGASMDAGTYATAQVTGGTPEAMVGVIINPDAVYWMRMSGGATAGTALTTYPITSASAGGTALTTGESWTSPEFDEGMSWFYTGANVGQSRKITSTSSTAGTVTVPYNVATVVGDLVMRAPYTIADVAGNNVQFTSNLLEADASIAVGTGAEMRIVDHFLGDIGSRGTTHSRVYAIFDDHIYNLAT